MKLQIIQLDPTDDQVSIKDKLTRVKAERVLLVWPRRGLPLADRLNLVLVQRAARDLGIQLGLLSHDPKITDTARQIGLPWFESVEAASREGWPEPSGIAYPARPNAPTKKGRITDPPHREQRRLSRSLLQPTWLRTVMVGIAAVALLALLAALIPSATVILDPVTETQDWEATIWITLEGENAQLPGPSISGLLRATTVSASQRAETTGSSRVPDEAASGQLLFTNLTQEAISLAAGTSVRASELEGARFVTTESAELEAEQGALVTVTARAVAAGPQANVPAGTIDAVDGPVGLQVQVTNPEAFVGGTERIQSIVAQADLERLQLDLERALLDQGVERLEESLPPGQALIRPSLKIEEIIEMNYDAQVGQPANSLGLSMAAEISAVAYPLDQLYSQVEQILPEANSTNWNLVPKSLTILARQGVKTGDQVGVGVAAEWHAYQTVDVSRVRDWLVAAPAEKDLADLPAGAGAELIQVEIRPDWWPYYPFLAHRISLEYPWQVR